jgi:demethylmenaquinone methyltransferase/2-methoxy-6-polyprenyl-1,4-benzoquinol methylase
MSDSITTNPTDPLNEQLAYYCARASEYDQWWLRLGRYDRGAEANSNWFKEGATVASALHSFQPTGSVLELAGGTGIWSEQLLPHASHLTVVDGSTEMLALNAVRLHAPNVTYVAANLFEWHPTDQFDVIFFGFWLSHVPPDRFNAFWELVRKSLKPGGRFFFVDSRRELSSTAVDHRLPDVESTTHKRRLNDGREFQVIKVFYEPEALAARLKQQGWYADIRQTENYFIYGSGSLAQPA